MLQRTDNFLLQDVNDDDIKLEDSDVENTEKLVLNVDLEYLPMDCTLILRFRTWVQLWLASFDKFYGRSKIMIQVVIQSSVQHRIITYIISC